MGRVVRLNREDMFMFLELVTLSWCPKQPMTSPRDLRTQHHIFPYP